MEGFTTTGRRAKCMVPSIEVGDEITPTGNSRTRKTSHLRQGGSGGIQPTSRANRRRHCERRFDISRCSPTLSDASFVSSRNFSFERSACRE